MPPGDFPVPPGESPEGSKGRGTDHGEFPLVRTRSPVYTWGKEFVTMRNDWIVNNEAGFVAQVEHSNEATVYAA